LSSPGAAIPIIFFFLALAVWRIKGYAAGTITVALTLLVAIFSDGMPVRMALASAVYGFFYGLFPIARIIVCAVLLYKVTVTAGHSGVWRVVCHPHGVRHPLVAQVLQGPVRQGCHAVVDRHQKPGTAAGQGG
jgi:hypothetical protein